MKVYIHTDIEGVAGWVFFANANSTTLANSQHTQRMNQLLTNEVIAASQAAIDCGADEVWVNDAHGCCYNILFEQLPDKCQIIHGRPGYFDAWLACFDATVDALVCIGQHAMAGTPQAVCRHSLWYINDSITLSEATMAAALAGYHGVPCVAISGDDKVCAEATEKIPQIVPITVKWGIAEQNARSLIPNHACQLIYQGVRQGIENKDRIKPFIIPGPYRINASDRDPDVKMHPQDISGQDFWHVVHQSINRLPFGHYGQDPIDDKKFRWPD